MKEGSRDMKRQRKRGRVSGERCTGNPIPRIINLHSQGEDTEHDLPRDAEHSELESIYVLGQNISGFKNLSVYAVV